VLRGASDASDFNAQTAAAAMPMYVNKCIDLKSSSETICSEPAQPISVHFAKLL